MTARDEFPESVRRTVGERAAYICTSPACRRPTVGPHSDPNKSLKVGEACHICAAAPGGPRYDPQQTASQRREIANAIWLCAGCSTQVDKDEVPYPASVLRQWVAQHEEWLRNGGIVPTLPVITISTLPGLTLPDVPSTMTAEDCREAREHTVRIVNPSPVDMLNVVATVQVPEPIVRWQIIHAPPGAQVDLLPVRTSMVAFVDGGGTISRGRPPLPTNAHTLQITRIPSTHRVEISLITSIKPYREHDIDFNTGPFAATNEPPYIRDFIDGEFQFEYRGAVLGRRFFARIDVDKERRGMSVTEVREDFGDWKPVRLAIVS
jgi:hypothetical protein